MLELGSIFLDDDGLINRIQARWEAISHEYESDPEPWQDVAGTQGRDQIESVFTTSQTVACFNKSFFV